MDSSGQAIRSVEGGKKREGKEGMIGAVFDVVTLKYSIEVKYLQSRSIHGVPKKKRSSWVFQLCPR